MRRAVRPGLLVTLLALTLWGQLLPAEAHAHPLAPALLELREQGDGRVELRFKTTLFTRSRRAAELLAPVLPERCRAVSEARTVVEGTGRVHRWDLDCGESLVGARVGVGGLAENSIDALLRVELADGRVVQRVLSAEQSTLRVPARASRGQVVASYLDMGVRHIFSGLDHLLFVLGLMLLVAGGPGYLRRLLVTLSAFTAGHCVTLSLAAVQTLRLPGPPIEFAIALSVLLLAVELARGDGLAARDTRLPWLLAGGFGLLHGLGFAGALVEAGLPEGEVLVALLSFNLGIELGQVAFVGLVLTARLALQQARGDRWLPDWAVRVPVYVMGSLAAMWCMERARELIP
jgi:hydrogenase/urease accessory protein HupE